MLASVMGVTRIARRLHGNGKGREDMAAVAAAATAASGGFNLRFDSKIAPPDLSGQDQAFFAFRLHKPARPSSAHCRPSVAPIALDIREIWRNYRHCGSVPAMGYAGFG
jgi:hypothetical protein